MIPLSRVRGPGVFGPRGDSLPLTAGYGKRVPDASADISPVIAGTRPPRAVGDVVLAAEPLRHGLGNAATAGIWRVRGPAGSAILKVARPPAEHEPARSFPTSDEPRHWNYWRREPLAYQTGLAATAYADAGIVAPDLLQAGPRADGGIELWVADVAGTAGWAWPVTRLGRFAYELGVTQARWAGRVPGLPWLSRRWLAQYLAEGPARVTQVADADWDHPGLAVWPAGLRQRLRRLHAGHARLVTVAASAMRTLCHLDVWPANLIERDGTSVLLDWSFTGDGAIGEDIANLIIDSCTDGLMDAALLPEIAASATDGYLRGLRDGGWTGPPDAVRTAIAACGAAKYSWFAPAIAGRVARDHIGPSSYGQDTSAAGAARRVTGLVTLIADWADLAHG
jgi:hypothetical protein